MCVDGIQSQSKELGHSSIIRCIIYQARSNENKWNYGILYQTKLNESESKWNLCIPLQFATTGIDLVKSSLQTIIVFLIRSTHIELDMLQPVSMHFWLGMMAQYNKSAVERHGHMRWMYISELSQDHNLIRRVIQNLSFYPLSPQIDSALSLSILTSICNVSVTTSAHRETAVWRGLLHM